MTTAASHPRRLPPAALAAALVALSVAPLAPAAAAQPTPAVSYALEPAAPEAGEAVVVTLFQDEVWCPPEVAAVEELSDGIRVHLLPTLEGVFEASFPCLPKAGPSLAFAVTEPGTFRFEVVGADGALLAGETLDVGGEADLDPFAAAAEPGGGLSLHLHVSGVGGAGIPPPENGAEVDGQVIRYRLQAPSAGPPAFFDWHLEETLHGLAPRLYSVVVEMESEGVPVVQRVAYSRPTDCFANPGDPQLCLHGERFRVRAWYRLAGGEERRARAVPLSGESGGFWFFRADNLELLVKVLDGCASFDRYWVFASGLTDVGTRIEVTDTWSGETWVHETAPGDGFDEVRDTTAFATCDAQAP